MIINLIAISFFRGSPILPAGTVLAKPFHVRFAGDRSTVHFKMLAKMSKSETSQSRSQAFIQKETSILSSSTVRRCFSVTALSSDCTDTATLAVTREPPRAKSSSDLNPSLQDEVGAGLSRLYDPGLGGTPLMLRICLNVHILFALLLVNLAFACSLVSALSGETDTLGNVWPGARYSHETRLLIGRRRAARFGHRCTELVINRRSPTLHIYDDPGVARHSDLNNGPVGPISSPFIATHDRGILRDIVGFEA